MIVFIAFLILLTPIFSMIAPVSISIFNFSIIILTYIRNEKKLYIPDFRKYKTEISFFSWFVASISWNIGGFEDIERFCYILFLIITSIILFDENIFKKYFNKNIIKNATIFGTLGAILIFLFEYKSEGFITLFIDKHVLKIDSSRFYLYFLDKGCSLVSLCSWIIIYILISRKKFITAILYFFLISYMFNLSDSYSSYFSFILSGVFFIVLYISRLKIIKFTIIFLIFLGISSHILSLNQNPKEISDKFYSSIPNSLKHRLFIWKFTSEQIRKKPILGWGLNSSRHFAINEYKDIIYYDDNKWHPLPVHPHNIFLQILLEGGYVALFLFLAIISKIFLIINRVSKNNNDFLWGAVASSVILNFIFISCISYDLWQIWWLSSLFFVSYILRTFVKITDSIDIEQDYQKTLV